MVWSRLHGQGFDPSGCTAQVTRRQHLDASPCEPLFPPRSSPTPFLLSFSSSNTTPSSQGCLGPPSPKTPRWSTFSTC